MQQSKNILSDLKSARNIFAFVVTTVCSLSVFAATGLVLSSYSSVHNFFSTQSGAVTTIYAGTTANNSKCTSSPCDSCANMTTLTGALSAAFCNVNEIRPSADSLTLTVSTDNTNLGASPAFFAKILKAGQSVILTGATSPSVSQGTATFTYTWAEICAAAGGTTTTACDTSFATTITLGWIASGTPDGSKQPTEGVQFGIKFRSVGNVPTGTANCKPASLGGPGTSGDYQGFCYFTAYPGDKKAYIFPTANTSNSFAVGDLHNLTAPAVAGGVDPSGIVYSKLHVCWQAGTVAGETPPATPGTITPGGGCTDLTLDATNSANPSVSPMYVSGLQNGIPYYFTIASMDQAGIVTYFLASAALNWSTTVTPPAGATQAVIPGPVYGLLDGQSCFIATAAYGSILAPEVNTFRKFRGEFLLKNELGRSFVRTYYKYSPPLADFIAQHEILRFAARVFLFPILIFVKLALWLGIVPAISLLLGLFITGFYLQRRKKVGGAI